MSTFLERKQAFQEGQDKIERGLASKVRDEIDWLRTSPKARTTKSQSRIKQAYQLIEELSDVKQRKKIQNVEIDFSASERETRKLIVAKNLCKKYGERDLFKNIDLTLSPGTRIGIVGKNGTGKTTLLKLLAGKISQDSGTIKYADDLRVVYFDQHREQIPPHITLREALSPNSDIVNYRGQQIHVNGWAKRFLFHPDRLNLPVGYLSGGEKARILIAKLMLEPADVLFLDEPTNDLDIQTLEVIEESLTTFNGASVLISHDRYMMDRLCTQILVLGENCESNLFASYSQWEETQTPRSKQAKQSKSDEPTALPPPKIKQESQKLSYKERKELESIELLISEIETKIENLNKELQVNSSLELYKLLGEAQSNLERSYLRWQELLNKDKN
jgi:ATP-binding cassette subfamily F protein uup